MSGFEHRELARAKVNLSLKVLGKRDDGFHEMTTRMAPISLADELVFTRSDTYELVCNAEGVPVDESNLVSKAVRLFERETGKLCRWKIELIKRVPHGAGLGGGSGDAAAAMRALNELDEGGLSLDRMAGLLAEIGSDIPFFVYESVADCYGRGEKVSPVAWDKELTIVLLKPSFAVDTPSAYKAWKDAVEVPGVSYGRQQFDWGVMENDLEKPVFMKHRFLAEMKMWLLDQPQVEGAMMSGSGSTMMAVVASKSLGEAVIKKAKKELDPTLWGEVVQVSTF